MTSDPSLHLEAARGIVGEQLGRLRALASEVRAQTAGLTNQLRHAERQLDELVLQVRYAAEQAHPVPPALRSREAEVRARTDDLRRRAESSQRVLRELDQLVRQIEMSSATLSGADGPSVDPWVQALRAQVITGREEERVRLAREVHDGPAQVLANALMSVETCRGIARDLQHERLSLVLDRMREMTREGLQEVRRFIADLRPGRLNEQGLVVALHDYVRDYQQAFQVPVSLEVDALPTLPAETQIVLYRVVQESLQNAHKHARGAPVHVRLGVQRGTLLLSVRDEGPGFDPREVARRAGHASWGLTSMRERAELLGARFTVTSRPGQGTEVTLALPLMSPVGVSS